MRAAVAVKRQDLVSVVPEIFEDAVGLLIVETDTMELLDFVRDNWVEALERDACEFLVCGRMYEATLFEAIASLGVTRYAGGGLPAGQALTDALEYRLPQITDYENGPGCSGEHHGACGDCSAEKQHDDREVKL